MTKYRYEFEDSPTMRCVGCRFCLSRGSCSGYFCGLDPKHGTVELQLPRPDWCPLVEVEDPAPEKPPLGLMPRALAEEMRARAILAACHRYLDAGKPVPREWTDELADLMAKGHKGDPR